MEDKIKRRIFIRKKRQAEIYKYQRKLRDDVLNAHPVTCLKDMPAAKQAEMMALYSKPIFTTRGDIYDSNN